MISVVIPTLNSAARLPGALAALVPAAISGLISELVIADAGSTDLTLPIADEVGANIVSATARTRGARLSAAAGAAKGRWLMFLSADTVLEPNWEREVETFMLRATRSGGRTAAAFSFALDDPAPAARRSEFWVRRRAWLFGLPHADQGLLVNRSFYDEIGGFKPIDTLAEVDLLRRIGKERIAILKSAAITSAERFRTHNSVMRGVRDIVALTGYSLRIPPQLLARLCG